MFINPFFYLVTNPKPTYQIVTKKCLLKVNKGTKKATNTSLKPA